MDKAEIGENSFVAACAFVKSGKKVPANSLVAGVPAKLVRELTESEMAWKTNGTRTYQLLADRSRMSMQECAPLSAVPPGRKTVEWEGAFPLASEIKAGRREA
jgi:phenylacetic acid degradation protein